MGGIVSNGMPSVLDTRNLGKRSSWTSSYFSPRTDVSASTSQKRIDRIEDFVTEVMLGKPVLIILNSMLNSHRFRDTFISFMHSQKLTLDKNCWNQICQNVQPYFSCPLESTRDEYTLEMMVTFRESISDALAASTETDEALHRIIQEFNIVMAQSTIPYETIDASEALDNYLASSFFSNWIAREQGHCGGLMASSYDKFNDELTDTTDLEYIICHSSIWLGFLTHVCEHLPIGILIADSRKCNITNEGFDMADCPILYINSYGKKWKSNSLSHENGSLGSFLFHNDRYASKKMLDASILITDNITYHGHIHLTKQDNSTSFVDLNDAVNPTEVIEYGYLFMKAIRDQTGIPFLVAMFESVNEGDDMKSVVETNAQLFNIIPREIVTYPSS